MLHSISYLVVRTTGQVVLALTVLAAPWFLGGVEPRVQALLCLGTMLSLVLGGVTQLLKPTSGWCSILMTVLLLLVIGLIFLQMVPLSAETLKRYSPQAVELREKLLPSKNSAEHALFQSMIPELDAHESDATFSIYSSATRYAFFQFLLVFGVFLAGTMLFVTRKSIRFFVTLVALNGLALALTGIVFQLLNVKLGYYDSLSGFASFINKNNAAGYLCLCLGASVSVLLWTIFQSERFQTLVYLQERGLDEETFFRRVTNSLSSMMTGRILTWFVFLALIIAGILVSYSRGGSFAMVASLLIGTVAIVFTKKFKASLIVFGAIFLLGVGLVTWSGLNEKVFERLSTLFQENTYESESRPVNWRNAIATIHDYKGRGSGFGTYQYAVLRHDEIAASGRVFVHAENQYIEILTELGYIGLTLFVLMVALTGMAIWILLKQDDLWKLALGSGMLVVLTGQLFASLSDFGLYIPANAMLFAALIGVLCVAVSKTTTSQGWESLKEGHFREENFWEENLREGNLKKGRTKTMGLLFRSCFFIVCAAGLVVLLFHGRKEFATIAAIDSAQKNLEAIENMREVDLDVLDQGIEKLETALQKRPDSANYLINLASYKINRYRSNVYQALLNDPARISGDNDFLWSMTSLEQLHRQIYMWKNAGFKIPIERIRTSAVVQENLVPAFKLILQSRQSCPMIPQTHLLLAELVPVVDDQNRLENFEDVCIARAKDCTPFSSSIYYYCGVLEFNRKNLPQAFACWNESIRLSRDFLPAIVINVKPLLTEKNREKILDQVFPDDYLVNSQLYSRLFPQKSDPESFQWIVKRAETSLLRQKDQLSESIFHYHLGHLYFYMGEYVKAADELETAIHYRPDASWIYLRAQALYNTERYEEAEQEIQQAIFFSPNAKIYRDFQRKVRAKLKEISPSR